MPCPPSPDSRHPGPFTHEVPLTAEFVRGAAELVADERGVVPYRLPSWVADRGADAHLLMTATQPAGVRVAMRTTATVLGVEVIAVQRQRTDGPAGPVGVHQVVVDGRVVHSHRTTHGDVLRSSWRSGPTAVEGGTAMTWQVPLGPGRPRGVEREVELWLPHNETTRLVSVRTDAPVRPGRVRPVWLHHGSSISHGSDAVEPTGTWPAVAARRAGWDLVNRGFGGAALLDPFVATHLARTPADLVSVKVGINLVNQDLMRMRAFVPALHGFLDRIREGHPDTPLWLVTPILCPIHETTPGPTFPDPVALGEGRLASLAMGDPAAVGLGALTLETVRTAIAEVVAVRARSDARLHLLSGWELYGPEDHDRHPLPDDLHPGPATHREMGERFADLVLTPTPR